MNVSLIVPLKNEAETLQKLLDSIRRQTYQPNQIILVDGGSDDGTVELARRLTKDNARFRLIEAGEAMPGRGRNIGTENADNEWIAYTDAGIELDAGWLAELIEVAESDISLDIVYGNYSPRQKTWFEKCAVIAYVMPLKNNLIRGRFIASCLIKKKVWESVGGFSDFRASEDLFFMDAAEKRGFRIGFAPAAMIEWQLRPDFASTFHKFVLYSKHNVWAGRQWDWHYAVAKQYMIVLPFVLLTFFYHYGWLIVVAAWLCARTAKRILAHRQEFGIIALFNPILFFGVMMVIQTVDLATFIGWGQAIFGKQK